MNGMIEDKYAYGSVDVAEYIVAYANENHFVVNMTKMQKLLYIAYGVYLAVKGRRLTDEHPHAWPYGPVFPRTRRKLLDVPFDNVDYPEKLSGNAELRSLVRLVFDNFGKYNAAALSEWSHKPNSPWDKTVSGDGFRWGDFISDKDIKPYFYNLIVWNKNDAQR
jgi:uncharacterized phage-associated protein|nr:MAG TPA: hypothetical protein [Bacteriophage sp.]